MTGIYKITNLINGKVYIGQTTDIITRWNQHKRAFKNNNEILYRAMRKHGFENFSFEILMLCEEDLLDLMEIYYIKMYNSYIYAENSNGYNMTLGGNTTKGYKRTKKEKENMSKARKNGGNNNARKVICDNITYSCAKIFAEKNNKKRSTVTSWLNHNVPMPKEWYDRGLRYLDEDMSNYTYYCEDYRGKNLKHPTKRVICDNIVYNSLAEFCLKFGLNQSKFSSYLNHKRPMPVEWYVLGLRYEEIDIKSYKRDDGVGKIVCDNINYDSIKECAKFYNENPSTMSAWLRGQNKMPQKFIDLGLRYIVNNKNIK